MSSPQIESNDHFVTLITITPLWLPLKNPYIWSHGVEQAFIVKSPSLSPQKGKLSLPSNPGLGVEFDQPVVEQAAENFKRYNR